MAAVTLRPRRPEDLDFLRTLYRVSRDFEMELIPWPTEEAKTAFLDDQFRLQTLHYDNYYGDARFLVVELDETPIGRLYVHEGQQADYLMDILLLREVRNQGIGSRLLAEVIRHAHDRQRSLTCHVEIMNPAQRLYQRLGFRKIGEHGAYYELELPPPNA